MSPSEEELNRFVDEVGGASTAAISGALNQVRRFEIEELVEVIPRMFSTGGTGARLEALRDGVQARLGALVADRLVRAIDRFNRASTWLAWAMIFLAVLQTVLLVYQIVRVAS